MEPRRCSPSRAAGVGQGTLYRHFPTREALLAEVYREDFEELTSAASELASLPGLLVRWPKRLALNRRSGSGAARA
ncbi:TetR/AcrR family transcriptional regulator [Micromonospora marina]|nr:helix-turn-helix domain-containing protein [Micromonospora marina]